jgi:iron(III) transport system substrate-binding protein
MRNISTLCAGLALAFATSTSATAQPSGRLMVYTSQPSGQIAKVVEAFNKTHPKVQVSLFRSGTT